MRCSRRVALSIYKSKPSKLSGLRFSEGASFRGAPPSVLAVFSRWVGARGPPLEMVTGCPWYDGGEAPRLSPQDEVLRIKDSHRTMADASAADATPSDCWTRSRSASPLDSATCLAPFPFSVVLHCASSPPHLLCGGPHLFLVGRSRCGCRSADQPSKVRTYESKLAEYGIPPEALFTLSTATSC